MDELTKVEEEVIDLDGVVNEDHEEGQINTVCMVGRLALEKGHNTYYLLDVMRKAWRVKKNFSAREWGKNLYLFRFGSKGEMDWVLKKQPWHFDNHLFVIAPLMGSEQPSSINLIHASFWIRAYDLPINCLNKRTAQVLADRMGSFEEMDTNIDDYVGNFLRFKVAIDISKPLLRRLTLKLAGKQICICLKYEALPAYCFNCGVIGHFQKQCDKVGLRAYGKLEDIPYGPHIQASPLKRERFNKNSRSSLGSLASRNNLFPEPKPKNNLQSKTPISVGSHIVCSETANIDPNLLSIVPFKPPTIPSESNQKYIPPHARPFPTTPQNTTTLSGTPTSPPKNQMHATFSGSSLVLAKEKSGKAYAPNSGVWHRSKPSRSFSTPKSVAKTTFETDPTLAKRSRRDDVTGEMVDLQPIYKKLKETSLDDDSSLVEIPCLFTETAEIALKQSRREL